MRVVHVNLFDLQGGAARIAWTLMDSMTALGHDVNIFAHQCATNNPQVIPIPFPQAKWQQKLLSLQSREGLFDLYSAALLKVLEHPLFEQADIIHLHCTNGGYFSFLLLPFLTAKPTVWTLHDPLAFTAGCLNTESCNEWRHNWCAKCPMDRVESGKSPKRELVQLIKASIYKIAKFTAVCSSVWLERQARESILRGHDIKMIYNGVDTAIFRPGDRNELRQKLGLPAEKKIVVYDGFNDIWKRQFFLYQALKKLNSRYPDLILLTIGAVDNSALNELSTQRIDLPFIHDTKLLAEHYAAADLAVFPSWPESSGTAICEVMACGTPVVAFAAGSVPEIVAHRQSGYLALQGDSDDLACGISYFLDEPSAMQSAGEAARRMTAEKFSAKRMVDDYIALYEDILKAAGGPCLLALGKEHTSRLIAKASSQGWNHVWQKFQNLYNTFEKENARDKVIFVDRFFTSCLEAVDPAGQSPVFWEIIELWLRYRGMPYQYSDIPAAELEATINFCRLLRDKMHGYITCVPLTELAKLSEGRQQLLVTIWWQIFLYSFSPLNHQAELHLSSVFSAEELSDTTCLARYVKMMAASLYYPFPAGEVPITAAELWNDRRLPFCVKVVIAYWLLNVPFYNIEEYHREKFLRYAADLCQTSMSSLFFLHFVGVVLDGFWRVSYTGGNNVKALSVFGDFIARHMQRFFPRYAALNHSRKAQRSNSKIRVGYISRNFRNQAVSYYMVNRVIHHDKNKFEVYVFALDHFHDEISDLFVKYSTCFQRFTNMYDFEEIARSIVDSQLDILIYTDIGMDSATYMLSGLQLAPVQCALVGHGTTSGMPTIQYYISGDFEPDDADSHYREKLIKLPNLGAAQYPPPFTQESLPSRKDWKIPDDVVVFVSCANGIKHVPERDSLLIEILKKAPNSCLVLKPYFASDVENHMTKRLMAKAIEAGVDKRLFIIPPLKHVSALLAISDVQLDTYPYGGWTTNMEALYMGLPIVTQEGRMGRSRWGAHMLRALGIRDGIAANEAEYIEWAVRFAQDDELRRQVGDRIKEQVRNVLFNGAAAQPAYEAVLTKIVNDYRAKKNS